METLHRGWVASSFRFPFRDCSQTGSGRSSLTKVESFQRDEVETNEQGYLSNERGPVGCDEVESEAQTVIGRRLDVGYGVKSVPDQ